MIKVVSILVLLFFISTPLLAFAQQTAEMQQAHDDAERDVQKYVSFETWYAIGCIFSCPGFVSLSFATPKIPVGVLIGKSPTYVETYTRVYRDRASQKRLQAAGIGCLTTGACCYYVFLQYLPLLKAIFIPISYD